MVIPKAQVELRNQVTGYTQSTMTDDSGAFRFNNIPPNMYEIVVTANGFSSKSEPLEISNPVPISLTFTLQMGEVSTSVDVGASLSLIDTDPSAHTDANSSAFMKLPSFDPASGLSSIINNSTGGTAADANGFFHPLGDHAQVSFVIDGQPISDQQSKVFSTQLPPDAIQSMQLITGAPDAQYGDKSSLVVNATTKSGLGARSVRKHRGSGGIVRHLWRECDLRLGTAKFGNFIALNGIRTGHFLDTPEFLPFHDIGNNENIFDRMRLYSERARRVSSEYFSGPQLVPGSQQLRSIEPGPEAARADVGRRARLPAHFRLQHAADRESVRAPRSGELLRQPRSVQRHPGHRIAEPVSHQLRREGGSFDVAWAPQPEDSGRRCSRPGWTRISHGRHEPGLQSGLPGTEWRGAGIARSHGPEPVQLDQPLYIANPHLLPGLLPYDLTRGGSYFHFHGLGNINQAAFYVTDDIKLGRLFRSTSGLRDDQYDGLVSKNGIAAAPGLVLSGEPHRNRVARRLFAHLRNALQ